MNSGRKAVAKLGRKAIAKQVVISSYSDLSKISSDVKSVHFRKFVSRRLLRMVLDRCRRLEIVSLSRCASKRFGRICINGMFSVKVSEKGPGRPSRIESMIFSAMSPGRANIPSAEDGRR